MINSYLAIIISSLLITSNCFSLLCRSSRYLRQSSISKSFQIAKMSDSEANFAKDIDGEQGNHYYSFTLLLLATSRSKSNPSLSLLFIRQCGRWSNSHRVEGCCRRVEGHIRCRARPCRRPCRLVKAHFTNKFAY